MLSVQVMPSAEADAGASVEAKSTSRKARVSISKDPFGGQEPFVGDSFHEAAGGDKTRSLVLRHLVCIENKIQGIQEVKEGRKELGSASWCETQLPFPC